LLENETYIWDNGLHKDQKYINFINKIKNDPLLTKNYELKKTLDTVNEIYYNNIKNYKFKTNNQIFNAVIKTVITQGKFINLATLFILIKLMEEEYKK